jgi:transketolase
MIYSAGWGHIGGSYSIAEILAVLYGGFARLNPGDPDNPERDYIILSKAHCSPALYSALIARGFLSKEDLYKYCRIGGLEGHLDQISTPGVESTGGSLGIGLSYAAGIALALKKQEKFNRRVFCITGDGELGEGEIWEGVMFAAQNGLDNLILIVDYNKVMAKGFLSQALSQDPLDQRFRSFGWEAMEVDGHDPDEIHKALYKAKYRYLMGKPVCLIAHTVKGKGVEECEFNYKWHTHAPNSEKVNLFLKELALRYNQEYRPFEGPVKRAWSLEDVAEGAPKNDIL